MCFDAFPSHQNQVLKKRYFSTSGVVKTCFDAFPGHRDQVFKKDIFQRLEWLNLVLVHFQATRIKSLKKYFLTSGLVKNVFLCICAYFLTIRIKSLKKIFFNVWSG